MLYLKGWILKLFLKGELEIQVQPAAVKGLTVIDYAEIVHPWLIVICSYETLICSASFLWNLFFLLCKRLLSFFNGAFILGTSAICGRMTPGQGVLVHCSLPSGTPSPCPLHASSTLPVMATKCLQAMSNAK